MDIMFSLFLMRVSVNLVVWVTEKIPDEEAKYLNSNSGFVKI